MASITDVAKLVGCSTTLVSRVINNQYGVSEKSRKKILKAIDELGYTPNAHARSLVTKKTNTIGVVVDTLYDPYFFQLIQGLESVFDKNGYDVLFCNGNNDARKKESYIDFLMKERTDGILIYGSYLEDSQLIEKLKKSTMPFALIEFDASAENVNNVLLNNKLGAKMAVEHLLECGCHTIYHVSGDSRMQASEYRKQGFVESMLEHGYSKRDIKVLNSGWSEEEGFETIQSFLKRNTTLPDAFFFGSDQAAFGGMTALTEHGISIPGDIMIIGFDDDQPRNAYNQYFRLTTLHQPLYEMGASAAEILLDDIGNKNTTKIKRIFTPSLVIRDTTARK